MLVICANLQVLKNMGEILKAGGADYSSVVKTTIMYDSSSLFSSILLLRLIGVDIFKWISINVLLFLWFSSCRLADLKDFKTVNEIYAKCEYDS